MLTLYALLLLMVLCWSGNFIAVKFALREFSPFALACLRVWLSTLLLVAIYFASPARRHPRFAASDFKNFALLGLTGIALNQTGFTVGLHYTTVAHSALIITLGPIFVLLLARWQGLEALTSQKLLGMGLSFLGAAILTSEHGFGSTSPTFLGDAITLAGSVAFAVYTVAGKRVATSYSTLAMNTFAYLAGAAFLLPLAAWQLPQVAWSEISWRGWLALGYVVVVASVLAYQIYYYALARLSASRVVAFTYLQPVLGTLLGVVLLGESLSTQLIAGGSTVLVGVYLTERPGEANAPQGE